LQGGKLPLANSLQSIAKPSLGNGRGFLSFKKSPRTKVLQFLRPIAAKPERNETEHAERTVNQPPPNRNSAQAAENEGIGNYLLIAAP
jgi:hypothetical protein